jgi:hypothetical protein
MRNPASGVDVLRAPSYLSNEMKKAPATQSSNPLPASLNQVLADWMLNSYLKS